MTKTYLAVASHWSVPGVRQYGAPDRATAERKCVEYVNDLISDWTLWSNKGGCIPEALPPVIGSDWESSIRALQLARLASYFGGEGEANDELLRNAACNRLPDPPLIGEAPLKELAEYIEQYVQDDDRDPDGIGFPMVWIEEVESAEPEPVDTADLETVLDAAQRFADEGEPADQMIDRARILAAIERLRGPLEPYPPAFGALDLGEMLSVIGWAKQFTADWNEDANSSMETPEERLLAVQAVETVEKTERALKALFPLLGRVLRVLGDSRGAIDCMLHQISQMSGMFDDEDGTIVTAEQDGIEASHILGVLRDDLKALGVDEPVPVLPVRIVVDVSGGCVQGASADGDVEFFYIDYDTDGADEERLIDVPQPNGKAESGTIGSIAVEHNPVWISAVLAAEKAHEAEQTCPDGNHHDAGRGICGDCGTIL